MFRCENNYGLIIVWLGHGSELERYNQGNLTVNSDTIWLMESSRLTKLMEVNVPIVMLNECAIKCV